MGGKLKKSMRRFLKNFSRKVFPVFAALFSAAALFYFFVAVSVSRAKSSPETETLFPEAADYDVSSCFDEEEMQLRDYCYHLSELFSASMLDRCWDTVAEEIDNEHLYERCGRRVEKEFFVSEMSGILKAFTGPSCRISEIDAEALENRYAPDATAKLLISDESLSVMIILYIYQTEDGSFGFFFEDMENGKFGAVLDLEKEE